MYIFWLRFHWNLFARVQLTIFRHWFRWWLGAILVTSHYLSQWCLDYWRIYESLGLNELTIIPRWTNGPMTIPLDIYGPRRFHRTWDRTNRSSSYGEKIDGWMDRKQMDARMDRRRDIKGWPETIIWPPSLSFGKVEDKSNPILHKTWQCQTQNRVTHSIHTELIFDVNETKPSILNFQRAILVFKFIFLYGHFCIFIKFH